MRGKKFLNNYIGKLTTTVPLAFSSALRMQPRAVLVATRCQLRIDMHRMIIATKNRLRMCVRTMPFAFGVSALSNAILHVEFMIAIKQVLTATAWRVVTFVAGHFAGLFARYQKISHSVRSQRLALWSCECTIAVGVPCGFPFPAFTLWTLPWRFVNIGPKALDVSWRKLREDNIWEGHDQLLNSWFLVRAGGRIYSASSARGILT